MAKVNISCNTEDLLGNNCEIETNEVSQGNSNLWGYIRVPMKRKKKIFIIF